MTEEVKLKVEVDPKTEKQTEGPEYTPTELEAQEQGWVPKEEWKGAEEDWVSAKAFIKYGQVESELKRTRSDATQKEKVIKTMKDYYLNVKEDAKKEVLDTLKRQKRDAIKDQNYEEVAKLDLQLDELSDNLDRKFKAHDERVKVLDNQPPPPPPEFFEWNKKNSWYKLGETSGLTKEADVLAVAYAGQNPNALYGDVLHYVGTTIKKLHEDKFEQPRRSATPDVNEPGEATGADRGSKKVKLSPAEKQAAENFGMSYEDYAKGLKQWDKMKGNE